MNKTYKPYKHLTYADRQLIDTCLQADMKITDIAEKIGVHRNTIYRELARCGMDKETYNAEEAQRLA